MVTLKAHLQRHDDVYDRDLKLFHDLLVGEKEDDGLCAEITKLQLGVKSLSTTIYILVIPLILAIIAAILAVIFK